MELILLIAVIGGGVGAIIGRARGRVGEGLALGAFIGPIGWLLIFLGPDERLKCPWCKGVVPELSATRCMHCGESIQGVTRRAGESV